ncbi:MAG: hypothetical protein Q8P01_04115 [bacterium]|nr:hypothetical protein [bacterium]
MTMTKRLNVLSAILLVFVGIWWNTQTAEAVGIGAVPAELNVNVRAGKNAQRHITVRNPSSAVSLFDVYPDEFADVIRVIPSSFVLEGGKEREVTVRVGPEKAGIIQTMLSITSQPLSENEFGANAGVKVPIVIRSSKAFPFGASLLEAVKSSKGIAAGTTFALLALGILLLVRGIKMFGKHE